MEWFYINLTTCWKPERNQKKIYEEKNRLLFKFTSLQIKFEMYKGEGCRQ